MRLDGTIAHEQHAEDGDAEAEGKGIAREVNEAYEDEGAAVAARGVSEKKAGGRRGHGGSHVMWLKRTKRNTRRTFEMTESAKESANAADGRW